MDFDMGSALKLRDYQRAAVDRLLEDGQDGICSLAVLPTGAGKTVILRAVIEEWLRNFPDHQILLLAHRTRLLEQARERFAGIPVQTISASMNVREAPQPGSVTVASIQTLAGMNEADSSSAFKDWDLVLVDEAHRVGDAGQYATYLSGLPRDPVILGVTATPWRMDANGKHQLVTRIPGSVFQRVACWIQPEELISRGFLLRPEIVPVRHAFPRAGFKLDHGEIAATGVSRYLHLDFAARMAEIREKTADARHVLIFCETVKDAGDVAAALDDPGHPAGFIDGTMPEAHRRDLLQAFQDGRIRYLVNVDVFTEGLDVPEIDAVVLLRMTQSVTRFLQMVGRGLRPFGEASTCRFLDYGHHIERLGAIEASRGEDARPLDERKRRKRLGSAEESARWKVPPSEDMESDLPGHLTAEASFTVFARETRAFPFVTRNGKSFLMMRFAVDDPAIPPSDGPTVQKRIWIERKLHPQDPLFAPLWDRWSMLSGTSKKRVYDKGKNPVESLLEKRVSEKGFCAYDPFALRVRWSDRAHRWMIDGMQWEGRKVMHITSEEDAALSVIVQELKNSTRPMDHLLRQFLFRVAHEGILEYREGGGLQPAWLQQQETVTMVREERDQVQPMEIVPNQMEMKESPLESVSPPPDCPWPPSPFSDASLPAASYSHGTSLPAASPWPPQNFAGESFDGEVPPAWRDGATDSQQPSVRHDWGAAASPFGQPSDDSAKKSWMPDHYAPEPVR
ncbi:DEAD/DEAH box helicase [Acidithiobacillus sp. CV18-2]|nr:DEAD/DEAH box helicase [Acidithiobacillus sp. CV18-3]MBU2777580.1 DEAD/DEAH box helicase [Acidithiobacillus sp. CV18-2]MBU2799680.1 DEAD/DEAH box helicase [Acidithiobacillus sp. VAN18-4]